MLRDIGAASSLAVETHSVEACWHHCKQGREDARRRRSGAPASRFLLVPAV